MQNRSDTDFQQSISGNEINLTTAFSFEEMNFDVGFGLRDEKYSTLIKDDGIFEFDVSYKISDIKPSDSGNIKTFESIPLAVTKCTESHRTNFFEPT